MLYNRVPPSRALHLNFSHDYRLPSDKNQAGGDVIALTNHVDGTTALLVGDVSAKGSEGTAFASWLATLFNISAAFIPEPSDILKRLNTMLCQAFSDKSRGLFAGAFVCRFFPAHRRFVYACAGTESPILFNHLRPPEYLDYGGMVLGVDTSATYEDAIGAMDRDDMLIAYTDGVTESLRSPGSEPLGSGGVLEAVWHSIDAVGRPDSQDILTAVDRLNGGVYHDDATLAVVGFSESRRYATSRSLIGAPLPLAG